MARLDDTRELDISAAWAEAKLPGDLRLTDGRRVQVVYRGVWSNSNGPDFQGALVSIDAKLHRGSVEIHARSSEWHAHGHGINPAYDDVVLHVVLRDDARQPALTRLGQRVATLELGGILDVSYRDRGDRERLILSSLGARTCLPTLGSTRPELVRRVLVERGWSRLVEKQLRFSQDLQLLTAPEVLYRGLLDALGYSANRSGMVRVGEYVPLQLLEPLLDANKPGQVLAALLGVGGFLPLSPAMAEFLGSPTPVAALEPIFAELQAAFDLQVVPPQSWTLNRVRPANHPVARLASLASLLEGSGSVGLFEYFISLPLDGGTSWDRWLETARPGIGKERRQQVIVNILAPFLAAYAELIRDESLQEQVAETWEELPGKVGDRIARSTRSQIVGRTRFPIRLALEEQGLHDIYRTGCANLRCFECPIARLAVEHEAWGTEATV
ncbi:MAG: DUF2851 family protein [Thermomicrobiales bacterium]